MLCAIGRRAFTQGCGIENLNVYMERGAIVTDEHMQTNIPGVYAIGDVNGKIMLAHAAYREAEVAVNNMLGKKDRMRYDAVPSVIYTHPEVASCGMTEDEAKRRGIDIEEKKLSMRYSGRFVAENEGADGICKILVNRKHRNVVGVHMIGNASSEIIWGASALIETEMQVRDIKELIFPHPTVSEILREVIWEFDN